MPEARLYIEENVEPAVALARGAAALAATDGQGPVGMYGASLRGEALVLGAHQLGWQALPPEAPQRHSVLRRASGGVCVRAGDGIVYVALALRDRASLMPCPRGRILNRNVRGALAGLRAAGVTAHYFGRDFLSVEARPAAYVGWAARTDGRVLLEFFFCERSACFVPATALAYPSRSEEPLRGKAPITLEQAQARAGGRALIEHIAGGYRSGWNAQFVESEPPAAEPLQPTAHELDPESAGLQWSHPREEAIGFVSAGVALDAAGKLARLQIRGDFFADDGCALTLERMLLGVEPTNERIGRAVDAAYGPGGHDVEGVRDLRTFQAAILDAAASAREA